MIRPFVRPELRCRSRLALALLPLLAAMPATAAEEPVTLAIPLAGFLGQTSAPAIRPAAAEAAAEARPGAIALPRVTGAAAAVRPLEPKTELVGPRVELANPAPAEVHAPEEPKLPLAALWPLDMGRVSSARAQFHGEHDSLAFSLFVPPGIEAHELTLAAVSSAFILPSRSTLRVFAGDELIGEMPLRSISKPESVSFKLPRGTLHSGFNLLRVEVNLAHRLYCGAHAAYDLWTSVDLTKSGIRYTAAGLQPGGEAFLAAASVARGSGKGILVRDSEMKRGTSGEMREISRQLGRTMGGGLTFTTREGKLRKGAMPPPVIEISPGKTNRVSFRAEPDGRQIMEVRTDGSALPDLFGTPGIAQALARLPLIPQDVPVPLSTLGFETTRISQHLWIEDMAFRLPNDWLINVRERAVLQLAFAYLSGLPTGAELRIRINGEVVRIVPLDRGGRLEEKPLEVRFDAGLLKAGRNVLGFEVSVPGDPEDEPCLTADVGRIEIRDTSTLTLPSSPKMHMPGLSHWMSGGGPLSIEAASNAAHSGDDTRQWELYLSLAAALHGETPAAGQPAAAKRLVVLRETDLSRAAFGEFSIGRQVTLLALQPPRTPVPSPTLVAAATAATLPEDPFAIASASGGTGPLSQIASGAQALGLQISTRLSRLIFPDPVSELADWLGQTRGQAILFQLDRETPEDLYLLLSDKARIDDVLAALETVAQRGIPLSGHLALLTWDNHWQTWTDETRLPVLEEPVSERNWRGVLGNFASARPRIFVGIIAAITILSVLIANSYIGASRRQR
ncbi:cellulose biosynthesis cyclic di-GMP-binding regulatory protein BcsB [Rhodobacteraceae bacterium DSL-40]|uniref:cellulose biosynthesis cyclic di-GMP-binding regulatory protein BcsB n=1 Tax=Amaricoccus sp. B4 TaxID=3368557 RepID=UPI0013A6C441